MRFMRMSAAVLVLAISAVLVAVGCGSGDQPKPPPSKPPQPRRLQAFCGAASKPAMEECAAAFEKKTGIGVDLQFGGSGAMLSAIKMAGRGDLYIPGSPDYMAMAERDGIVEQGSSKIVAYLVPCILVQPGNPKGIKTLEDLAKPGTTVGIGNPQAVCVGLYAVEILDGAKLLDDVGRNVVVHVEDCAKTAALLSLKKVDAILGWSVFSKWNPEAIEAVMLDPERVPRLAYIPAGVCRTAKDQDAAKRFVDFLASAEGQALFAKKGYIATEEEARKFAPKARIGGEYRLPANYKPPSDKKP
jgi:molybdate transport system substrate-binding protein